MRIAIFLDGEQPSDRLIKNLTADCVICADGAYNYLKNYDIRIDAVIGDFDSFRQDGVSAREQSYEIIKFPSEKDQTDSELAVAEAIARGAKSIDFYGAMGKRDDHALANIGLLFKADTLGIRARIVTDYNIIRAARGPCTFSGISHHGQLISIVPFAGETHIIDTDGLKYGIKDKTLTPACTTGISNEATDDMFTIRIQSGNALVITVL